MTSETRVWSGGANVSGTFNSFSLKQETEKLLNVSSRSRFQYITSLAGGLNYEDTTILGQVVSPTPDQGRVTTFNGRLGETLIFDLYQPQQPGIGEVQFDASLSGETAPSALSDHFNYTKWQAAAQVTLWFGWQDSRQFLLRQNLRNGSLFGTVPSLDLFRLGGSDSVRGLQQGELAGHSVLSTSTELGYSLAQLGRALFGNSTNSTSASPLDGTYLKGFFDWGRTSPNGSIGSPWHEGDGAVAYGAAIDIAKPSIGPPSSFTLGYAFSPQSHLHRSGMVFVSANFPF